MRSLNELLQEAKFGKLTENEVNNVVQQIQTSTSESSETLYTLLHILGRGGSSTHRKLVEKFLYYPAYPMVSSIALKILCNYWDFTGEYLNELKAFIRGLEWDQDDDVRLTAIVVAGEFLRNHRERELIQLLINIFENKNQDELSELFRDVAYESLARAVGREWNDIIAMRNREVDLSITDQAKQLNNLM